MEIFTYKDYLKYQKFLREKGKPVIQNVLCEDKEAYNTHNKQVNHEHDKIFRRILGNKKEATKFINNALKIKVPIREEQIEKYNSSFVTLELRNQESDIIYKMKEKNIFFLIEHQTKINYTMPLRILEYECEIIKSSINKEQLGKKDYKFPVVITIVLYTGEAKWNVKNYIRDVQEELEGYENLEFAKYNIVDVNDYTEDELLQEESFLSKAMLIEKARYSGNLAVDLEKIVKEVNKKENVYTKEQKELLIVIIKLVLSTKLDKEEVERLIKNLKGGEKPMLAVLEMLEKENKRIFRDGKREGKIEGEKRGKEIAKIETAKKMLEEKATIEFIMKVTGLSKETIEKLK